MVRIVIKLLNAVKVTESAVSAFARCEIKLEVAPPGQAAKIINPTAISGANENVEAKTNAIMGKKLIDLISQLQLL